MLIFLIFKIPNRMRHENWRINGEHEVRNIRKYNFPSWLDTNARIVITFTNPQHRFTFSITAAVIMASYYGPQLFLLLIGWMLTPISNVFWSNFGENQTGNAFSSFIDDGVTSETAQCGIFFNEIYSDFDRIGLKILRLIYGKFCWKNSKNLFFLV